jgi:putative hemolysin
MSYNMIKKNIFIVLFICSLTVLLIGCTPLEKSSSAQTTETPAYQKCVNEGGLDKIVYDSNGQTDLCLFSDGTVCDQQELYAGTCSKGQCLRKCDQIGTRSEGWYDCNNKLLFYDKCENETAATAGTC